MRLEGKVAVVTGAGSGNGKQTALLFAREGAKVVAADMNLSSAEDVVEIIRSEGGEAIAIQCDVTKEEDAKCVADTVMEKFGRYDVLVNNAGIIISGTVETLSVKQWDKVMDVNVKGIFLMSKYAVPAMRKGSGDRTIINIGSGASVIGCGDSAVYCASKGAVAVMTKAMAIDHAADGIRVNCVCPGIVDTPFNQRLLDAAEDPVAARKGQENASVLKRLEKPEEVAKAVLFMASDDSSFCAGSVLMVDGGVTAQ